MGTRSKIILASKEENKTLVLYKHWDGYPTDNLKMLAIALKEAITLDAIAQECSKYYGREDMVEGTYKVFNKTPFFSDSYPLQGDLEWLYIVDVSSKSVEVYGNEYGTERELFANGRVNPVLYSQALMTEYIEAEKARIIEAINNLVDIGYQVNGQKESSAIDSIEYIASLKEQKEDTERKLRNSESEIESIHQKQKEVINTTFLKLDSKTIKAMLEASGLKISKVTKCKEQGKFNVYIDESNKFKSHQTRTTWQYIQVFNSMTGLELELK